MNVFNLTAKITLDDKEYVSELQEVKQKTTEIATETKKTATSTKLSWAAIGASIGAIAKQIYDIMYNTTEWAGAIKDLAQVYGMTYEQIQEVNYLAQESGKNAEWAIRKAQSSGKEYWEVLGLTNEEYKQMIAYANEMGIILNNDLIEGADVFGDKISQLKYQWQSVLASLLAGDENAEKNLSMFFDRFGQFLEEFVPQGVVFAVRLFRQVGLAIVDIAPTLITELIDVCIENLFSFDWVTIGLKLGSAILQGVANIIIEGINTLFGWMGVDIPRLDLGIGSGANLNNQQYEITTRSTEELTIRLESNGVTSNDKLVVNSLEDKIDEILGRKLGGV